MKPMDLASPKPTPKGYVTPTTATTLLRCPTAFAFGEDPEFADAIPSSPALVIGNAGHRVLERAGRGELEPGTPALTAAWDEAIAREAAAHETEALKYGWGQAPDKWPFYAARRARTLRLARRLADRAWSGGAVGAVGGSHARLMTEVRRSAFGDRLHGRIDAVDDGPPKRIEDYKTGAISDAEDGAELRREYVVQMQLYAVLEHARDGEWPEVAALVPIDGPAVELAIVADEAAGLAQDVLRSLDEYLEAVDDGALMDLARPTPENCGRCRFSGACRAFWSTCNSEWSAAGVAAIWGVLVESWSAGGRAVIRVASDAGSVRGDWIVRGLTEGHVEALGPLVNGRRIAASGLRIRGDEANEAWVGWDTQIRWLGSTD